MSGAILAETRRRFEEDLERREHGGYQSPASPVPAEVAAQAEHWRAAYEEERVRLAKLLLLYRDLEAETVGLRESASATAPARIVRVRSRARPRPQPFQINGYTLYRGTARKRGGGTRRFYFFAKHRPKSGRPTTVPPDFEVRTTRSGLPVLRRVGGGKGVAASRRKAARPAQTGRRGPSANQRRALAYARDMKRLRARARTARGGKGPIASRAAARKLRSTYGYR